MDRRGAIVAGAAAWIGLVLGHVAAYALAYPSGGVRHAHLLLTGHGWMGPALLSLAAAIPAVLAAAAVRSARNGPLEVVPTTIRLMAVQVPAFLLVESLERHDAVAALADPAVMTGLLVQAVVAAALAAVLAGFTRVVDGIRRRSPLPSRRRPTSDSRPALGTPRRLAPVLPTRRRAPPVIVG